MTVHPTRALAGAAIAALAIGGAAESASVPTTPAGVAAAFVQGFLANDPASCELATPRLQQLLARVGRKASCRASLAAARAQDDAAAEADARRSLREAVQQTQVLIDARAVSTATRRVWIGPHFGVSALVADMRLHDISVRAGRGPDAARGTPTGLVVLDTMRTTATSLVLYTESTSGTIWRLASAPYRIGTATRAGRGVPARPTPRAQPFPYAMASGVTTSRVAVTTWTPELGTFSFLLTVTPERRVDSVLIGSLATPLLGGTGPGDPSTIAERLVRAWQRGDPSALCAELHPRLTLAPGFFGTKCDVASRKATATRVAAGTLDGWAADGTTILAVRVDQGDGAVTMHHVVTPTATGYAVTGMLYDLDDIVEILLRPI